MLTATDELRQNAERVMLAIARRRFPGRQLSVDWGERDALGELATAASRDRDPQKAA